jgi:hypothetical protein
MSHDRSQDLRSLGECPGTHTAEESEIPELLAALFEASPLSTIQRLAAFPRHVRRQDIARFLTRYELFKLVLTVNGSIVECGVFAGGGLISWLQFSSIMEPYNHTRKIIGFDTFSGFPRVHPADLMEQTDELIREGAFQTHESVQTEIEMLAAVHDKNRPLGHLSKIELVAGDAVDTIPAYTSRNQHVIFSLLYLDFDLYEPTKVALEHLYPRVVKGGVVAFDELNCPHFPGETRALLEMLDGSHLQLQRCPMDPYISWFIK